MTETILNTNKKIRIHHSVSCEWCNDNFELKFVRSKQMYSQKNNWGYWTEKEEDKDKYICSDCLKKFYQQDYLNFKEQVTNSKKMQLIRVYFQTNIL